MKLVCIKCKKEREMTDEEIIEVGEFVTKKNMKAMSILKYMNLSDGENCDKKEHRYGFSPEFLTQITEKIQKKKDTENKLNKNKDIIKQIEDKIEELKNQLTELSKENEPLSKDSQDIELEILKTTKIDWTKWL